MVVIPPEVIGIAEKIITKEMVQKSVETIADRTMEEGKNCVTRFVGNYFKRRDVGFNIFQSIGGGFNETTRYYKSVWSGQEPTIMNPAIYFDNKY